MTNTDLAALSEALAWTTGHCPNAPYVAVKREIVERLVAGDLVLINREGMRERVAKAICRADPAVRMGDADGVVEQRVSVEWPDYVSAADAAIAAILGEQP